ncbi:MAG: transglutaminase-like domain-containing protein [Desulfosalsimonadaceae bacterium]
MQKRSIVAVFGLCCVIALLIMNKYDNQKAYALPKQIRYSFTLQNKTNQLYKDAKFWAYAPVKLTSTQSCQHIESSESFQIVSDQYGNQILQFSFDKFPPYASRIISIKADLLMSDKANKIPANDTTIFLQSEKSIEVNHPDIIRQAKSLEYKNLIKTVENIFNWVSENVTYSGYDRVDRGALYAFTENKGDCTEYALLFAALCRADEIPARSVLGYLSFDNGILKPSGFHNWVEFFNGSIWQIADPQNKILMKNSSAYVAMKIVNNTNKNPLNEFDRFHVQEEGIDVIMN